MLYFLNHLKPQKSCSLIHFFHIIMLSPFLFHHYKLKICCTDFFCNESIDNPRISSKVQFLYLTTSIVVTTFRKSYKPWDTATPTYLQFLMLYFAKPNANPSSVANKTCIKFPLIICQKPNSIEANTTPSHLFLGNNSMIVSWIYTRNISSSTGPIIKT